MAIVKSDLINGYCHWAAILSISSRIVKDNIPHILLFASFAMCILVIASLLNLYIFESIK